MTPGDRLRIAELETWRGGWLECAARVRARAEDRAVAWVERRIPARFEDCSWWQLPERLQVRYRRREDVYGERLARAARHEANAEACRAAIATIRTTASARKRMGEPTQSPMVLP